MPAPERGEVWLVDLGYAAKVRPCLVLSVPPEDRDRALATVEAHTTSPRNSRFEVSVDASFLKIGVFDARMVGLSERSVATWETGADLKESSLRTIVEVGRLYTKLRQSFASPEQLTTWLKAPNNAFGGSQPLQVIERGEIDRIWRMIYFLESGSPS